MKHTVLIIDDDTAIREMMEETFSQEPYKVLMASSADEALRILSQEPVDVVISDEIMPGLSGSELLAVVRINDELVAWLNKEAVKILVLVISGDGNQWVVSVIPELEHGETIVFAALAKDLLEMLGCFLFFAEYLLGV